METNITAFGRRGGRVGKAALARRVFISGTNVNAIRRLGGAVGGRPSGGLPVVV